MSESQGQILRELFEQFQMGWFLQAFPSEPDQLMVRFNAFAEKYAAKLQNVDVPDTVPAAVDVDALARVAEENPVRAHAFLQVFASSVSREMLAMTWLLQHDAQVTKIDFSFEQRKRFDLTIVVQLGRDGDSVSFHSGNDNVFDIAVLRHFGTLRANDKPIISGFYPLNLRT